ncbi:hypothetical protein TELCIR_07719 [Teladorsagia circumcincta]|uniref:Uncharacterized protein n=1 Tax=Teladorsagia circumcincta TaxID=45464 RepID=A0A2G9UJM3_TELCI|nr:hypothetical protein TELCIR_07719 [Teladorsagia circumcincta]
MEPIAMEAIHMATSRFQSPSHRAAARPVIIIVGSSYRDGGYSDPTQVAHEFRADGGTIITIEYVRERGVSVPILQTIASPNFTLTNRKSDGTELHADELRQLLCEANCFCKKDWMPYKGNGAKWDVPNGGCYYPFSMPSVQVGWAKIMGLPPSLSRSAMESWLCLITDGVYKSLRGVAV